MVGKIKSKEEVALGTLEVVFETTEDFTFKPGQYCIVTLKNLNYPDERGPKRQFSINNSPNEKGVITITTRISESGFKKTLKELPLGTEVELGPIGGQFILPENIQKPLVFIAGGIGITPFRSMLKYVAEQKLPFIITLIYSNRDQASTAYLQEMQNYTQTIPNFKLIPTMTEDPNWPGEKRMINAEFIKEYFADINAQNYMVVGPPGMVAGVERTLFETGILAENITKENFTGY